MAARFTDEAWADRADKRPPGTLLNARGLGRPREQATARHTPGCARPRPAARTSDLPAHPGMREAGACRAHAPTVAHRKMREAEAGRANQRPPGTPRDARGRGRPRERATSRHTPGCARPGPVVRTPQRWHTGRCARPRPAARGTPGRTCPTGPGFVGSMCEHDTRVCRPASRVGAPASRWGPGPAA